ncbi:hypothetical protein KVD86_06470 [Helicobacter pylori]|nr:hypothetical protein KVD86_06470 [Helicobacter pylori]
MRQEHETATSFNKLKEITRAMHALKNSAPTNANNQASETTQEHGNHANALKSDEAKEHGLKNNQENQKGDNNEA